MHSVWQTEWLWEAKQTNPQRSSLITADASRNRGWQETCSPQDVDRWNHSAINNGSMRPLDFPKGSAITGHRLLSRFKFRDAREAMELLFPSRTKLGVGHFSIGIDLPAVYAHLQKVYAQLATRFCSSVVPLRITTGQAYGYQHAKNTEDYEHREKWLTTGFFIVNNDRDFTTRIVHIK